MMKWKRLKDEYKFEGERVSCKMEDICAYDALPCSIPLIYFLNDVRFDKDYFGETYHVSDGNYGCADAHFEPFYEEEKINDALSKYNICKEEYCEIAEFLKDILYVGYCGWCV